MSSSSVCQELQSCLVEPRVLSLKLAPPPPSDETNVNNHGGFSFLNCISQSQHTNNNTSYVHPVPTKRRLSDRSLQMCTESLGSETGSETTNEIIITTSSSSVTPPQKTRQAKQMSRCMTYPPPLTSGVQVRPRREGGRLLLEAVTVNTSHTYFHAERSHGRLRLSIIKDSFCQQEQEEDDEDDVEAEEEQEEEEEEEEEDIEGINEKESGLMKKVSMPSRCKEGANNDRIVKWDSLWVVTSS